MILKIRLKSGQELELNEKYLTSFRYEDAVTNSEEIRIGVAPSATLDFTLVNRDNILSGKKFDGCEVVYYNDNNDKIGTFDCSEIKKNKKSIDIELVDKMMKFEVDWKGCSFPTTTYELLLNICGQCNISLRTPKNEIINGDVTIREEDGLGGETCRTILKYLCEIFGSYANMDQDGNLVIDYYDFNDIKGQIKYGECTYFEIDESTTKRAGVLFKNNKTNVQIGDTSSSYIIEDNPIAKQLSESVKYEIGQRIIERIKYTSLKSGEFILSKKDLKEGDVIEVVEENGEVSICVVSKIVFENLNKMTIFSYGDTKNTKDSTSTSTSSTTDDSESYDSEVYLGRGQNHQKILAKGGTYVLVEKLISNITTFSKVNLNLFVNFNYNQNKVLYFDIFTNDKLVKSLKFETKQGFNQFSIGFLADIDLESVRNLFSCKITLEEGDILEIEPFECQMSFIVKSCKINDAVAANQYFVEKYKKISNSIFNQNRFTIKNLREKVAIKFPIYTLDVSIDEDESVIAEYYEDGSTEVSGYGMTKNTKITEIAGFKLGTDAKNAFMQTNSVSVSGDVRLGNDFFYGCKDIEEARFSGEIYVGDRCFEGSKLTTLIGEENILTVGNSSFRDCNLVGTFNFMNCISFDDYSFYNNPEMNFIKLRIPLAKFNDVGMEHCFENCLKLGGIVVLNKATALDYQVHKTAFKNAFFGTFMLMSDVNYSTLSYLQDLTCTNPKLYVCEETWESRYLDKLMDLQNNYGFTIIFYVKSQEEEILNKLYEENSRYYEG